jgi:hypothetical protein
MKRGPNKPEAFRFVIKESHSVETLPMRRLAEYMRHLAALLGEHEHVHFRKLEPGSVAIVQQIDRPAVPKVRERLNQAHGFAAPDDIETPRRELDKLLAADNAKGTLFEGRRKVLVFEGRDTPKRIGPIEQDGQLDGTLIKIGGPGPVVWADLQNNDAIYHCQMDQETAKRLAPYIYGATLRVFGQAIWYRDPLSGWELERLQINRFDVLSDEPLDETVTKLRDVRGSAWEKFEDPLAELQRIRHGKN